MNIKSISTLALAALLGFGVVGCKKKMDRVTPLPGYGAGGQTIRDLPPGGGTQTPITTGQPMDGMPTTTTPPSGTSIPVGEDGQIPVSNRDITGRPQDREKFREQIVYFGFDRSTVSANEATKVQEVAKRFREENPNSDLLIEGHCDERGTEGYNMALGERRALALREMLVSLGVPAERIHTVSYGKDRPADPGHNEEAWRKNRRGEFILVLPR